MILIFAKVQIFYQQINDYTKLSTFFRIFAAQKSKF